MASDYTTNFNLDKYVGTDKPNLRDQYNSAMDKIDAQLKLSSDNAALAVQTANNAASAVSGKAEQSALNAEITTRENADTALGTRIDNEASARQSADTALGARITNETSARESADNALQILTERNAVYIGNSYTSGVGDDTGAGGLFGRTKDVLFNHAYRFVASGAGFTTYGSQTQFITLLQEAINSTAFSNDSITDIVIIAAAGEGLALHNNPSGYKGALFTAVSDFSTLARENFSHLKKIFLVLAEAQQTPFHTTAGKVLEPQITPLINKTLRAACNETGYIVYGGWIGWEIQYLSNFFYDSIHPNANGYRFLAYSFVNAYYGNYKPSVFTTQNLIDNMFGSSNSYLKAVLNISSNGEYYNIFSEHLIVGSQSAGNIPSWSDNNMNDIVVFNAANGGTAYNKLVPLPAVSSISESSNDLPAIIYINDPTGNADKPITAVKTRILFDSTNKQVKLQGAGFMPPAGNYAPLQYMQYMVHYEVPSL